ncbi:hypothetical protein SLS55_002752 [Diplodia seriata]|uniref:Uncharacterized protein n=1 Tax=Diplodia seriata TaxID=420778 RepID=A0ABR3CL25_9PEZI
MTHIRDNCTFSATSSNDTNTQSFLSETGDQTLMKIGSFNPIMLRDWILAKLPPLDIGNRNGGIALVQWLKVTGSIYRREDPALSTSIQQNTTFEARRCLLYVGVRIISARVDSGSYSETVLSEIIHADNASNGVMDLGPGPGLQFHLDGNAESHGVRATLRLPPDNWVMLSAELTENIFYVKGSLVNATQGPGTEGPDVARMLYATENTTQSLDHLAHYLNVALRANDTVLLQERTGNTSAIASSQAVNGTVWVQVIFVRVRWEFLILPAVLLVLTGFFLVVTMVKSQPKSVGLWKSNPLALLLHADQQGDRRPIPLTTSSALDRVAATMKVNIVLNEDGCYVAKIVDGEKANNGEV